MKSRRKDHLQEKIALRNRPNKIYNLQLQQHLSSHPLLKMETVPLQPALRPRLLLKTVAHLNFDLPLLKYIIKAISNQRLLKGLSSCMLTMLANLSKKIKLPDLLSGDSEMPSSIS